MKKSVAIYLSFVVAERARIEHPNLLDHKDQDPLNNQRTNLRAATKSQNMMNRGLQANTDGVPELNVMAVSSGKVTLILPKKQERKWLRNESNSSESLQMNKRVLIHGDCASWDTKCDCIFMDPPDSIGLKYDDFVDHIPNYIPWLAGLISKAVALAPMVWVSYNAIHDLKLKAWAAQSPALWMKEVRTIIWYYTFCQYNDKDLSHGYRPILLIKSSGAGYPNRIREESERMRLGDSRAAGPKVPSDVWDFPRVVGNSPERKSWHPTQHPVVLYDRVMKYSVSLGGHFVDYFTGTGTCFRAGLLNPTLRVTGIEQSEKYCDSILKEHPGVMGHGE